MRSTILGLLLAAACAGCAAAPESDSGPGSDSMPPVGRPEPVAVSASSPGIELLSQDRTVDLSRWQFVPEGQAAEKLSAAVWHDRLRARRESAAASRLCVRYVTSGAPEPEFTSVTHAVTVSAVGEVPQGESRPNLRVFDACVDVTREPVGEWFDVDLRATCWNSLNDDDSGWAALPIVDPTAHATFAIDLPTDKAARIWERRQGSRGATGSLVITDDHVVVAPRNTSLSWTIDAPQPDGVYMVSWEW